jgi:hypothetical protein
MRCLYPPSPPPVIFFSSLSPGPSLIIHTPSLHPSGSCVGDPWYGIPSPV